MTDDIYATGSLLPDEEVELSFETSGKVVAINFTEGTAVKKGDLLAKVNDETLQAQLSKYMSQLKLAEDRDSIVKIRCWPRCRESGGLRTGPDRTGHAESRH